MPDLAHLREVAEAATPGRWVIHEDMEDAHSIGTEDHTDGNVICLETGIYSYHGGVRKLADAKFIATFDPPTVLKMIVALETMEALVSSAELGILGLHVGPLKAGIWKDARKDLAALAEEQE